MTRRRRKNPFDPSSATGILILGVGAFVVYEIYQAIKSGTGMFANFFKNQTNLCNPTSVATTMYEGITGQSPAAPTVTTGNIQMPDGSIVPVNNYNGNITMIPGTQTAEIQTQNGPVYITSGITNANGDYIASQNPPSNCCYVQASAAWQ